MNHLYLNIQKIRYPLNTSIHRHGCLLTAFCKAQQTIYESATQGCRMVISTGVGEASSVGAGRCAYRMCFQPSPLTSLTAKSERST